MHITLHLWYTHVIKGNDGWEFMQKVQSKRKIIRKLRVTLRQTEQDVYSIKSR